MKKPVEPEKTLHEAPSGIQSRTSSNHEPKRPMSEVAFAPACQIVTQLVSQAHEYGALYKHGNLG
jgi:hypothetical protein